MLCKKNLLGLALCLAFVIIQVNCEDVAVAGSDNELNKAATNEPSSEIFKYIAECKDKPFQFKKGGCFKKQKRQLKGGPKTVDADDPELNQIVKDALKTLKEQEQTFDYELVRIKNAKYQTVSGSLHTFDLELKNQQESGVTCGMKVWYRPWIDEKARNVTTVCGDKIYKHVLRTKRPSGGEIEHKFRSKLSLKFDHRNQLEHKTAVHNSEHHELLFKKFQQKHGRHYSSTMERQFRFRIFKQNLEKIEELNSKERGTAKYGINQFADMTSTEFKKHTGMRHRTEHNHISNPKAEIPDIQLPTAFDWRDKGAVSQVKNQGSCGSCWAFSVIGNIEGLNAIKTGTMEEFSEQELVDCDELDNGCNGGYLDYAYKAIEQLGGLESEANYPYTAEQGKCHMNKTLIDVKVKGGVDLPKNETQMAQWLLENGPISIGINSYAIRSYTVGVAHPSHSLCSAAQIDHAVLIVGFGVEEDKPYWIVKNSWGPEWGEEGFFRVFRGDNTCGVSEMASSAVLE